MNAAIEIHDSELSAIVVGQDRVTVRLDPAYVHRSPGRPGHDPGSGWLQPVEIVLFGGEIETPLPDMPCTLDAGCFSGGADFVNGISMPFALMSAVKFEAYTLEGNRIVIRGAGIEVKAAGQAKYVEEFPGA